MSMRPCSEFPNANPDLHEGAIVGCDDACGPCVVVVPAARAIAPGESGFFAIAADLSHDEQHHEWHDELPDVAELEPFHADEPIEEIRHDTPRPCRVEADALDDGFARVVVVLERVAAELVGDAGPRRVQDALSGATQLPPPIAFALLHWRALLRGEDSPSLPELTLDEWAAGFLAALCGMPASELRGRVRSEGIAAFGVLDAA